MYGFGMIALLGLAVVGALAEEVGADAPGRMIVVVIR